MPDQPSPVSSHIRFMPYQDRFLTYVIAALVHAEGPTQGNYTEAVRRCVDSCMNGTLDPSIKEARKAYAARHDIAARDNRGVLKRRAAKKDTPTELKGSKET